MSEHDDQAALFQWAEAMFSVWPELRLLHAIPNGGFRGKATAAKLKAEGVKAGIPDVMLPIPRGGYHGLYIEMKFGHNKPRPEQLAWLAELARQGYAAVVCYGWEAARDEITTYLRRGK